MRPAPLPRRPHSRRHRAAHGRSLVPGLERLEDRTVLSTLTVLNDLDKGAGSLRDAIAKAKDGDTIVFDPSLAGRTVTLTGGALVVKNSVDIEGPGAGLLTISGGDASRVFDVGGGLTVTIAGLTIAHGRAAGRWGGGGLQNAGSALALVNDVFSDNRAVGSNADGTSMGGGAITNRYGGTLTVSASRFLGNQAVGREGGFGEGGAIWNLASATITDSTFTGNRALGGDGGRITGGATIIGSANGGAVFNQAGATLTVANSVFTGNEAIGGNGGSGGEGATEYIVGSASGGGITNGDHATIVVGGCTFTSNRAIGGSNAVGGAGGLGRVGNASGGGLANLSGSVATMTGSAFDHNEALGGSGNRSGGGPILSNRGVGGAISNIGLFSSSSSLIASNLTLGNNRAAGGAGGPGGDGGHGLGGGIYSDARSTLEVRQSTIIDNLACGGAAGAGGGAGSGVGGGLYLEPGGSACLDAFTRDRARRNRASTSDDDIFGLFTICP